MKKQTLLFLLIITVVISGCNGSSDARGSSNNVLDMQGFELKVPRNYECTGGFTDGYRYLDAKCTPKRGSYEIIVDFGLTMSGMDMTKSFAENIMPLRVREYDATCVVYNERVGIGAEHYICPRTEDGQRIVTMGIGKVFEAGYARWFEAHLVILETDYDKEEYVDTLVSFVGQAIDIDWDFFDSEKR